MPMAISIPTQRMLIALWNTEAMGLLPVVLMSPALVLVGRIAATRIVGFAITISILALLASPIVAWAKLESGVENDAAYIPAAVATVDANGRLRRIGR